MKMFGYSLNNMVLATIAPHKQTHNMKIIIMIASMHATTHTTMKKNHEIKKGIIHNSTTWSAIRDVKEIIPNRSRICRNSNNNFCKWSETVATE